MSFLIPLNVVLKRWKWGELAEDFLVTGLGGTLGVMAAGVMVGVAQSVSGGGPVGAAITAAELLFASPDGDGIRDFLVSLRTQAQDRGGREDWDWWAIGKALVAFMFMFAVLYVGGSCPVTMQMFSIGKLIGCALGTLLRAVGGPLPPGRV